MRAPSKRAANLIRRVESGERPAPRSRMARIIENVEQSGQPDAEALEAEAIDAEQAQRDQLSAEDREDIARVVGRFAESRPGRRGKRGQGTPGPHREVSPADVLEAVRQ